MLETLTETQALALKVGDRIPASLYDTNTVTAVTTSDGETRISYNGRIMTHTIIADSTDIYYVVTS
jgi:hypothetical protein